MTELVGQVKAYLDSIYSRCTFIVSHHGRSDVQISVGSKVEVFNLDGGFTEAEKRKMREWLAALNRP